MFKKKCCYFKMSCLVVPKRPVSFISAPSLEELPWLTLDQLEFCHLVLFFFCGGFFSAFVLFFFFTSDNFIFFILTHTRWGFISLTSVEFVLMFFLKILCIVPPPNIANVLVSVVC